MEIIYYGHACFRLRERGASVYTDPYPPELGAELPRLTASIVTVSHQHPNHNDVRGFRGSPYVIQGPGEYEISGVFVTGVELYHDEKTGQERGKTTAYVIEMDGVMICHLGDLGYVPSQEEIEELGDVDVLLIPVGGRTTITGTRAAEIVNLIDPRIVIPMHYKVPGLNTNLETEKRFLREMGVDDPTRVEDILKVTASSLPEETTIMLLTPQL